MADLRGKQLKDSYQNVVTRGTGNKLENGNGVEFADLDDKASLSGGADANFTLMPQVGGSLVIERDSNSDGEWVRFAEGTQISKIRQSITTTESRKVSANWAFPADFNTAPSISGSYNSTNSSFSSAVLAVGRVGAGNSATTQDVESYNIEGNFPADGTLSRDLIAIGTWK